MKMIRDVFRFRSVFQIKHSMILEDSHLFSPDSSGGKIKTLLVLFSCFLLPSGNFHAFFVSLPRRKEIEALVVERIFVVSVINLSQFILFFKDMISSVYSAQLIAFERDDNHRDVLHDTRWLPWSGMIMVMMAKTIMINSRNHCLFVAWLLSYHEDSRRGDTWIIVTWFPDSLTALSSDFFLIPLGIYTNSLRDRHENLRFSDYDED